MGNPSLERALKSYRAVEEGYVASLERKGLRFAARGADDREIARLRGMLAQQGAVFRNGGASISCGWLSKVCVECTGMNGSETFSTTFRCHRDCYFCFNRNLAGYDGYVEHGCPWEQELAQAAARTGGTMAVLGLTGGEPLLDLDDSIAFLERAHSLFPKAHLRMYTSGDLLTADGAARLRDAGLTEIRVSVKQDDPAELQERVLDRMALATRSIPDVVVEMPIIPGTGEKMQELMRRFSDIGIKGMNLLEFCFPFSGWDEFEKRGFSLRNPPFPVMYDYGYSGGLAVAGSEELCLSLMLFGLSEKLGFGMHYCSLENKHRSEMRQRNEPARQVHPIFEFDDEDFFVKTAKVFGDDREPVKALLDNVGFSEYVSDDEEDSLAFPPRLLGLLDGVPVTPMLAFHVLENDEQGRYLREVALKPAVM